MLALLLFFAIAPQADSSLVSWMRPDTFHLTIGMPRAKAVDQLASAGLKTEKGKDDRHLLVDYSETRSLTLEFDGNRLASVRFELYVPDPRLDEAFSAERKYLRDTFGEPKPVHSPNMLIYDRSLPNVMVVATPSAKVTTLASLVVRYFDPAAPPALAKK